MKLYTLMFMVAISAICLAMAWSSFTLAERRIDELWVKERMAFHFGWFVWSLSSIYQQWHGNEK